MANQGYICSVCNKDFDGEPSDLEGLAFRPPYTEAEYAVLREVDADSPEARAIVGRHEFLTEQPRCIACAEEEDSQLEAKCTEIRMIHDWRLVRHPNAVDIDPETGDLLPVPWGVEDLSGDDREDFEAYRVFTRIVS